MTSALRLSEVRTQSGTVALDVEKLSTGGRYVRQSLVEVISGTASFTTTWVLALQFPSMVGFKAGSLVRLTYVVPCRNDSTSWGGAYLEPQVSISGGAYQSLGSCGYDGSVMNLGNGAIGTYTNMILINPAQASDFSLQFRLYAKSYDGTTVINGSHDINAISGTASLMPGVNGLQHYAHIIVDELASLY